jgi:hypothetical protein
MPYYGYQGVHYAGVRGRVNAYGGMHGDVASRLAAEARRRVRIARAMARDSRRDYAVPIVEDID